MTATQERRNFPTPEYAYDIEAHSLKARELQQNGSLVSRTFYFHSLDTTRELNHTWYILNGCRLISDHCDEDAIGRLQTGELLIKVEDTLPMPEVFDGRYLTLIAAVLSEDRVIYQAPDFDLKAYCTSIPTENRYDRETNNFQGVSRRTRRILRRIGSQLLQDG